MKTYDVIKMGLKKFSTHRYDTLIMFASIPGKNVVRQSKQNDHTMRRSISTTLNVALRWFWGFQAQIFSNFSQKTTKTGFLKTYEVIKMGLKKFSKHLYDALIIFSSIPGKNVVRQSKRNDHTTRRSISKPKNVIPRWFFGSQTQIFSKFSQKTTKKELLKTYEVIKMGLKKFSTHLYDTLIVFASIPGKIVVTKQTESPYDA